MILDTASTGRCCTIQSRREWDLNLQIGRVHDGDRLRVGLPDVMYRRKCGNESLYHGGYAVTTAS